MTETKRWVQNPSELAYMAIFYTFGFTILKSIRRDKKPVKLRNVKLVYNSIMSVFSLYICHGTLRLLIENYMRSSSNILVCDANLELFEGMEWYFQIFYYSKYVEFIDTFFLVMAGAANWSVRMCLHFYHHLITPTIVYATWFYPATGGWIGPLTNGFVHVVMYAYYGLSVVFPGIKKYGNLVTYIQLLQFLGVILYHVVWIVPSHMATCKFLGTSNAIQLLFNCSQYAIFLFLFLFFFYTKNKKKPEATSSCNGTANGVLDGKHQTANKSKVL